MHEYGQSWSFLLIKASDRVKRMFINMNESERANMRSGDICRSKAEEKLLVLQGSELLWKVITIHYQWGIYV